MDESTDPFPTPTWVEALRGLDAFYEHPVQGTMVARAHREVLVVRVLSEMTAAEAQARFHQEVQDLKAAFGRNSGAYWRCFDSGEHTFNKDDMCACGYRSPEARASDRRRLMERLRGSDALMSVRDMADHVGETPQYITRVLLSKPDFPKPMTDKSGNTRIWFEDDVIPWLDDWQYRRSLKSEAPPQGSGVVQADPVRTGVTKLETADDITEEIVILVWGIIADRYRNSSPNWDTVWEVAQGSHLEDDTLLDLGSDYASPALKELKHRVSGDAKGKESDGRSPVSLEGC